MIINHKINKSILLGLFFIIGLGCFAQFPAIQWQKSLGGTYNEIPYCMQQTFDNGYILAGVTDSNDGDVSGIHGSKDCWIVKLFSDGTIEWQKTLGGSNNDIAWFIEQTADNGFIVAASSTSSNGDITVNHGSSDFWIVKLDAGGSIQWQKSLGGSANDDPYSIKQTPDGGYIACGRSSSNDGDVTGNHGANDVWVVKLNSLGDIEWQKSLGGTNQDIPYSLKQTLDNGFIIAATTQSNNGDVSGNHGAEDYWLVKLDSTGAIEWQKTLGGTGYDRTCGVVQATNGDYIIAGDADSNNGDVTNNHGGTDFWIVSLDSAGTINWQKTYGGGSSDYTHSISKTANGYIVAGTSTSNDGDVSGHHGSTGVSYDIWAIEIDTSGLLLWQKSLGGSANDEAFSAHQDSLGGYIISGSSWSNDGDVSGHHGTGINDDFWIVKLSNPIGIQNQELETTLAIYPNPSSGNVYIELQNPEPLSIITVYNMNGIELLSTTKHNESIIEINLSSLATGMYILSIKTGKGVVRKKIIKQ